MYDVSMISYISGKVIKTELTFLVINVGGLGYKVFTPTSLIAKTTGNQEVSLWTHLAVRENSLDLYGFESCEELEFFELLISVSGIGPKSALAILNMASLETLIEGVASGDTTYLTKVSGIGKKNAQKIIMDLKDKVSSEKEGTGGFVNSSDGDVLEALTTLGYSARDAREAIKKIPDDVVSTEERIKQTLKNLGNV